MSARASQSTLPRLARLALTLSVAGAAVQASPAAAQERPDFAGEWTIQAESGRRTDVGFGSGWGRRITIEQDAATLIVYWPLYTRGDLHPPLRFRYALDGSPTTDTLMMGRGMQTQVSRVSWQGNTLVITTVQEYPHPETGQPAQVRLTRTLALASPSSLIVTTSLDGAFGQPATTTRVVYTRQ